MANFQNSVYVGAGVGTLGVALAFGLAVVAMAYTIGGISGCHINPAITLGVYLSGRMSVYLSGRMSGKDAGMYMLFQVIGAVIGSAVLFALVSTGTHDGPTMTGSNSFKEGMGLQAFIAEAVFTFIFVLVVLGTTDPRKGAGNFAGLAIGPAIFEGGTALGQLWLFIVAPFVGAALSSGVGKLLSCEKEK